MGWGRSSSLKCLTTVCSAPVINRRDIVYIKPKLHLQQRERDQEGGERKGQERKGGNQRWSPRLTALPALPSIHFPKPHSK